MCTNLHIHVYSEILVFSMRVEVQSFSLMRNRVFCLSDLCSVHADDAIAVASAIVKVGHGDGLFTGRNPVLLGGGIDLEDMSSSGEDRLLPET